MHFTCITCIFNDHCKTFRNSNTFIKNILIDVFMKYISSHLGMKNRTVGSHNMNDCSSRSHTMLTVYITSEQQVIYYSIEFDIDYSYVILMNL